MKWNVYSKMPLLLAVMYLFVQWMIVHLLPEAITIQAMFKAIAALSVACYLAVFAVRHEGPTRIFWIMVMLALICEGIAQFAEPYSAGSRGEYIYDISITELLRSMEMILFTAGLVYLFGREQGLLRGLRFLFDIVIIFIVIVTISWEYFLMPKMPEEIQSGQAAWLWLHLSFSVGGIILIFFTIVMYMKVRQIHQSSVVYLCLSGLVFVIGSLYYLVTVDVMELGPSPYLNLISTVAMFLIGVAGAYSTTGLQADKGTGERKSAVMAFLIKYFLPYVVLAGLFFLIVERFGGWGGLLSGLSLSVLFILMRQVLIQLENDRLLERLHESLKQSEYLAHHDDLTGLYNRRYFNARLMENIAEADRQGKRLGLLYMDLNQFKYINDNYGHSAGDLIIRMVADRLDSLKNDRLIFSRLGGDEFTVLIYPVIHNADIVELADRISDILSKPYQLDNDEIHTSSSIGVAVYPDHAANDQELIGRADSAMYAAKETGVRWRIYAEFSELNRT